MPRPAAARVARRARPSEAGPVALSEAGRAAGPLRRSGLPKRTALLAEAQDRFIAAWGQMGAAWGISRTMAEVYALLYITGRPLNTDEVMHRLRISRGNASMSLRALLDWGIVARAHKRGDRKEYFQAEQDVWAMFRAVIRERMKREVDPLLAALYEVRDLVDRPSRTGRRRAPDPAVADHHRRLDAMLDFLSTLESLATRFASPSGPGLQLAADLLKSAR